MLCTIVLVLTLLWGNANGLPEMPSMGDLMDAVGEREFRSLRDLNEYADSLLDLANLHMAKAFSAETRRYKRALDTSTVMVSGVGASPYTFIMADVTKFDTTNFTGVSQLFTFNYQDKEYWVLRYNGLPTYAVIEVDLTLSRIRLVGKFEVPQEFSVLGESAAYIMDGKLWMAVSVANSNLVATVAMDLITAQFETLQILEANGVVGGMHLFEEGGDLYLVIGIAKSMPNLRCNPESSLYKLLGGYFDKQEKLLFRASNVTAITGFGYKGNYYLIFGMRDFEGSHVYKFSKQQNTLKLHQVVPELDVGKILYFHEQQEGKNYIIMNNGAEIKLYRLAGEQLLPWQSLDTSNMVALITSIQTFTLPSFESIIMVADGGSVTFYTDDLYAHFQSGFVLQTNCNAIYHLTMAQVGGDYVIAYICMDSSGISLVYRQVFMNEINLVEPKDKSDILHELLNDLKSDLDARKPTISLLQDAITNEIVLTNDVSQTWLANQHFTAGLVVNGTTDILQTINIKGDGTAVPHEETFEEFYAKTDAFEKGVLTINPTLDDVLYYSTPQVLNGAISASNITADKFESNSTQITRLNEMPLLDLSKTFLIDAINQSIMSPMNIHSLKTDRFSTRDQGSSATINGFSTNELMRKSVASQVVTGSHDYKDIHVKNIHGKQGDGSSLLINGIQTNAIVTKGNNFTFVDKKTFPKLTVLEDLNVKLVNEVDLSDLASHLMYTNTYNPQILDGRFTLQDVTVDGNVDVSLINNVDMKELNNLVVKKSGDYSLSGDVTYQNNLGVTGTLTSPKLNGIDVSNIVDLQTDRITGNYTFTNVNVNTAINSNNINGIDTNVDVVTIDADETVLGRLTFLDDVLVTGPTGVILSPSVTINNIDLDILDKTDSQGNLILKNDVNFNATLHVTNHVSVDVINGLALEGIEDRYWRKTRDQIVTNELYVDALRFEEATRARSVNGHQMEDFLSVTGVQTINGTYNFQGLILVDGNLAIKDGEKIDGVDVSEVNKNLVTLSDDQDIEAKTSFTGKLTLNDLVLNGNLNGWNVKDDLTRLDLSLPHTGSLTFVDKTTATSLKLSNSNLVVQSLNGLNVENAKADLVLVNEDASIAGSLKFTSSVSAKSLDVSGTVDNVDMGDLVSRSLKKNSATAQSVSGAISVNKGVDFGQNPSLGVVNGKDWTTHLAKVVPVNYNGVISGRKTFSQPLSISGNFNPTTLNGFDVAQLASRILTKGTNQNVAGKYTINGDITARNVNAPEIDGVGTANLVLVDQTSSVSGTVTFAESLETKDITSNSGILDGCDLIQLNTSTVWRAADGSIEIAFPVTLNSLSVGGDCTVNDAVKAGTQEVLNFLDTLVLKSSDQEISGEVEFITDITMKNLVAGTADGVDIDNLYDVTVLDNEDSVIDCDVAFTTHLSVQDLDVTSAVSGLGTEGVLIDHINVTDMNVNAVLLQGGSYLMTGAKTFTGGLTTSGLGIGGSLGGIPVTELVVVSSSSRLADDLIFRAATTVKGDLQVEGLIDNVDLGQLLVDRIKLDSAETLTSSTSFQGINVEGDLVVEEINGISLSDIVLKSGRNRHDITGEKNFAGGLHAKGEIQATVINGVNIHELNGKIVRKDRATTINTNMIFENTVEAKSAIDVVGAVNGYKLSDVNYPPSVLNQNIISKSNKLADLNKTLSDIFVDTKTLACGMYETILYGEILNVENVAFSGKMSFGNFGDTPFLVLRECDILCTCASHYYFYHVTSDLDLLQDFNDEYSAFIFDTEGFEGTGIVNNCTGDDEVKLLQITDSSHNVGNLGAIADVAVFVVNGVPYMVTAGTVAEASPGATTKIHVVKMVYPKPEVVWSMQTPYSASSVDVTSSDDGWLLLVANQMALNDPIDPFTAPSQLYLWSSTEEKFSLVEEYIGQHVISGIFLNAQYGPKESFFSLAQLQAASSPVFEDNVKYTTQVLVFKLGETGYRPYQSLPSYGVVAQESLSIGDDLYLLLLSDFTHTLDVYENRPSEGFRLHQKIPICSKPIDVKKIVVSYKEFILVSCKEPAQIMKIRFLSKGFTYKE